MLARFSRQFPAVRLDATVDTYLALRDQIDAGLLDLAVTLSLDEDPASPLLRRTRFVWAAGGGRCGHACAAAPGPGAETLSAPEVATRALEEAGREWRLAFTSLSQQGLRAAVKAGLAITAILQEDLEPGIVEIDAEAGLPPLPQASFRLLWSASGRTPAAQALAGQLIESCVAASA